MSVLVWRSVYNVHGQSTSDRVGWREMFTIFAHVDSVTMHNNHTHTHTHTHTHSHTHTHTHSHTYARMHARTHAHTHTHTPCDNWLIMTHSHLLWYLTNEHLIAREDQKMLRIGGLYTEHTPAISQVFTIFDTTM